MEKLYALTTTTDIAKQDLYIRKQGNTLDFITYFNSFSLAKWKQYTTLQEVTLRLQLIGPWQIVWKTIDAISETVIAKDTCDKDTYERSFSVSFAGTLLGFELTPLADNSRFQGGAWYGTFSQWQEQSIGISICTFKREQYVKRTMTVLREFQQTHPWLSVLVVDNGNTLPKEEQENFRVIYNPNYGGSGGFTRGMIEYVDAGNVDYVLLMDDDIILDTTALERSYALLCGLREEYKDSFLAGAMLRVETPTIQHENTAYWGKIKLHPFGKNFDLSKTEFLIKNEQQLSNTNRYGAWWYCCIPAVRIKAIGYPLPVFVRGDDMEYGIRNEKDTIHMNGIGVWHQSFQSKISPVVKYYDSRNMLILNNYVRNCNFLTFFVAMCGHALKYSIQEKLEGMTIYYYALADYNKGFFDLTQVPLDRKMEKVRNLLSNKPSKKVILYLLGQIVKSIFYYPWVANDYKNFRYQCLKDASFWKNYFRLGR